MSKQRATGRMIRRDLADDEGMARLSDGAARLYFHLYPFLDSYGKWTGGPGTILETIVPRLGWSRRKVLAYLREINEHTSVKIWRDRRRFYASDLEFEAKQDIRSDKRGKDTLPPYPGEIYLKQPITPYQVPEYVPDQVRPEVKDKNKKKLKATPSGNGADGLGATAPPAENPDKEDTCQKAISPDLKEWGERLVDLAKEKQTALNIDPEGEPGQSTQGNRQQ